MPELYRNATLAALVEQKLRWSSGVHQTSASALTGRVLILFDASLSQESIQQALESALAAALEELRDPERLARAKQEGGGLDFQRTRRAQLQEISSGESDEVKRAERQANWRLALSVASLGLATVGVVSWPALGVASMVGYVCVTFPIYKDAAQSLRHGKVNVNTLVTITAVGSIVRGHFWVLNYASVIYSVSRKLLLMIQDRSRRDLIDVFTGHPPFVRVQQEEREVEIPFEALKPGDVAVVRAREVVPADGIVTQGSASVDQHILTGEGQPVEKSVGDHVLALTSVLSGRLVVQVQTTAAQTVVGRIGEILNQTAHFKSLVQLRAESLAEKTVVPTLLLGAGALPFVGPQGALGVINAHFRHKVSTVAPIAMLNFLNLASQHGVLIKDGRTLDLLNDVDTVVFDKTGTLTDEQPHIGKIHRSSCNSEEEILGYAAAAEQTQTHPFAKAILKEARRRQLSVSAISAEAEYSVGFGLTACVEGKLVRVGSLRFMEQSADVRIPAELRLSWEDSTRRGHSMVMVAVGSQLIGAIELLPTVRPEARQVIAALRQRPNIKHIYILSGDHDVPTRAVAEHVGADRYFAETLPEDKARVIEQLHAEGRRVCYMGDGINDSIALKKAMVSISLRGASSVAKDTAQIVMMDGTLGHLGYLFDLSKRFNANMNTTLAVVVAPSVVGMFGALFLRFGLFHTVLLGELALLGGLVSAMTPRFAGERAEEPTPQAAPRLLPAMTG